MTKPIIKRGFFYRYWKRILIFLSVFGPATITAMSDNDAGGVATYSIAGARLGYPILFLLVIITVLLGVTQEMGMRLAIISRKGLADLIREKFGVRTAMFMFGALLIANLGTLITDLSAVKTTSRMLNLPAIPSVVVILFISFLFIVKGNYKLTQSIMLLASLFYVAYIVSAIKAQPDWGLAVSNLFYPHGVQVTPTYMRDYLLIGMGVLGTTITPWGQFFISSFAYDKKIEKGKINYSQLETYWGAFLTDFFSFFMIVATAATLFVNHIPLEAGEQAALAIKPFAGNLAGTLFAIGILNAGFMGVIVVSLSTAYAFAEFFGLSGSLNDSYKKSKTFYILFALQLFVVGAVVVFTNLSLFKVAIVTQTINAIALPLVFYYLIKLTNDRQLMGHFANNKFQKYFAIVCTIVIVIASAVTLISYFIKT
ncbi:MAG: divalent metal cation transporter [Candidatus Atribacteria bacterium]|nr:divalent metal cation transporter [Candidatus Atribacteria bacterium]